MIQRVLDVFREAPVAKRLEDDAAIQATYRSHRNHVLYGSMACYALFYFCRANLGGALTDLGRDLHYKKEELGFIGGTLTLTYGVSKFLSGLVADRANPRSFMIAGLALSALANLAFGLSSLPWVLAVLWGMNGAFQSTGAPASAKLLAVWFSASERGTKTSIWNISHQGGGGLAFIFTGALVQQFGWRGAFIAPAFLALGGALLLARFIHDRPESLGLPPIEEHRNDRALTEEDTEGQTFLHLVLTRVLLNPRVWLVALASGCTYVVRYGSLIWTPNYLQEARASSPLVAGLNTSLLEFIGIPGAILCGWASDRLGARRAPVAFTSLVLLALSVWLLYRVPQDSPVLVALVLASVGFFTYGPQMLLAGVGPVDMSTRRVAAAAVGFTGLMSYLGASIASIVTGWLVQHVGWRSAFDFWVVAALLGALLLVPLFRYSPVRKA